MNHPGPNCLPRTFIPPSAVCHVGVMAVLAALATPNDDDAPDCAPRRIVSGHSDVELVVVQFEQNGTVGVPYVRMRGAPTTAFESTLSADPKIQRFDRLERTPNGTLYKVSWEVDSPLVRCMAGTSGIIVEARGTAAEWRLQIWFEDRADASAFQQCCTARDVPLRVDRLTSLAGVAAESTRSVSERQREALLVAYREGYFDEPRRVSQRELAAELDISSSAVGGRLRRGLANLLEETLVD